MSDEEKVPETQMENVSDGAGLEEEDDDDMEQITAQKVGILNLKNKRLSPVAFRSWKFLRPPGSMKCARPRSFPAKWTCWS